jgi:D-3-phosphoglycerate dehydrogenase
MVNRVFRGGEAAVAFIDVEGNVSPELLDTLHAIPHVLGVSVVVLEESEGTAP